MDLEWQGDKSDSGARAGALGKLAVDRARKQRLTETRELLEGKVASQLQEFKALHQSTFRGTSRLGYPRTLRYALPWVHGLLHSAALRGAADVKADERCALMSLLMVRRSPPPFCTLRRVCRCLSPIAFVLTFLCPTPGGPPHGYALLEHRLGGPPTVQLP